MSNRDDEVRAVVEPEEMSSLSHSSSTVSTEPATSQSHGALLRRDDTEERDGGQESSLADSGGGMSVDGEAGAEEEERVLHAWFNVLLRFGEVTGPEGTSTVQHPVAFMNCVLAWTLFTSGGMDSSELVRDVPQDVRNNVMAAMNQPGMTVTLVWDLRTRTGTLDHPRGRVGLNNRSTIQEMLFKWVVEPTVRNQRLRVDGKLPFDFGDPNKTAERAAWRQWLGPVRDTHAVAFLGSMGMFIVQPDVEALRLLLGRDMQDASVPAVSRRLMMVRRDREGRFYDMDPNPRLNVTMNYTTPNQDTAKGMWAKVEPFSAEGARVVLAALQYPSYWTDKRPVVLEIGPACNPLTPRQVLMDNPQVIDPWKTEGMRTAFHLVQSAARIRAAQRGPAGALVAPSVTIIVTPVRT